jgi:pimeloyl-ACP methyl ester carboxylesterase
MRSHATRGLPRLAAALPAALLACGCAGGSPSGAASRAPPAAQERLLALPTAAGVLRVSDGGTGEPALVLVHGLGSDLEVWRAQLDRLRSSRRVVAYDQRGHGGSAPPRDGAYTIAALADDLDAVIRGLGLRRVVLVGHSMSGAVLSAWAGDHPAQVAGLVYVDAVGDFRGIPRADLEAAIEADRAFLADPLSRHRTYQEMLGDKARPATRAAVLASVDRLDPAAFPALRRSLFAFEVGARLDAVAAPRVAIEAEGSDFPVMASRVIPGARRVVLPGVSHWLMLDDPGAFGRALDEALPPR